MKIICPNCDKSIDESYINKSKGLAYCIYCNDYYLLDNHLKRLPYLIKQEERLLNSKKPEKSKIEFNKTANEFIFIFPNRLPIVVRIFLIFFLCAFGFYLYQAFSNNYEHNKETYLVSGIFIFLSILIILTLLLKTRKTLLSLDKDKVQIVRNRYLIPADTRIRKTNGLDNINIYVESDSESSSSSEIEMKFRNQKNLRFGYNLRSEEQNWLAGQLILIRDTLTLNDKVTKGTDKKLLTSRNNPVIIGTNKPFHSNINVSNRLETTLVVPKDDKIWKAILVLMLYLIGMSIFGIVAIGFWGFLPSFEHHKIMKYVFTIFTLLAGYGLSYYLYTFIYRAEHKVFISSEEIIVELNPFGKRLTKVRPTNALKEITTSREWKCVILKFNGYKDLRVGFDLSNEEIKYVIGALKKKNKYCMQ